MLRRLRIQFVAVIMVIVTVMLCLILGMVYQFTKMNLERESIAMMRAVTMNPFQLGRPDDRAEGVRLPYFSLQIGGGGELIAAGGGYYDLSDEQFLQELVEAVVKTREETGVIEEYNLRFFRIGTPIGQSLVFADTTSERSTLNNLARNCALIGAVCFIVFLGISLALAAWTVKPVEKAWLQQRQFVSDASHELKTPLTVIMANAELLQSPDYDDASRARFSASILTMSKQMRDLVERLLELARADSGQRRVLFQTLDFSTLVSDALLPFEPVFFERGLALSGQIQTGIAVSGDGQHLQQLVDILLDNAQKYAAPQGTVTVRLERAGRRYCRLTVANPGEALSDQELKNIFKRFYRADQARSRDGSFGLGLSIAENITKQHHGRIWAESGNGMNSFYVELPLKL